MTASDEESKLRLYNTLSGRKEVFTPINEKNVRLYVCGPTVYDFAHIGNARPVIVFDVLFRLLRKIYGKENVTYVRNITDIDDKINARAREMYPDEEPLAAIRKLTEETAAQFAKDVRTLGCLEPPVAVWVDKEKKEKKETFITPRATEHIREMLEIIGRLVEGGFAYAADGHVLFEVEKFSAYGALSKRSPEDMLPGARVEVAPYKKSPLDFVLWKPSSPEEPGWDSPYGRGRPGWHIECSAMSWRYLKEQFDIHGGGVDLIFPHHENEIAQSCAAFHTPRMAQIFMHNGFVQVEGEKMAKSRGNFLTIRELLDRWPGVVLRYNMLMTHYREPLNWTEARLQKCWEELSDFTNVTYNNDLIRCFESDRIEEMRHPEREERRPLDKRLKAALGDDLNTPQAIAVLRQLYEESKREGFDKRYDLLKALEFLGLILPVGRRAALLLRDVVRWPHLEQKYWKEILKARAGVANEDLEILAVLNTDLSKEGVVIRHSTSGGHVYIDWRDPSEAKSDRIEGLIRDREEARKARNFAESDRLRHEIEAMGVRLKDTKDPQTGAPKTEWEIIRWKN